MRMLQESPTLAHSTHMLNHSKLEQEYQRIGPRAGTDPNNTCTLSGCRQNDIELTKRLTLGGTRDSWANDPHILAMAHILQAPIVILDQMAPTDNVTVFTPTQESLVPTTRSWIREVLPAFREGHKMVILHWVMHRQHYEPVIPNIGDSEASCSGVAQDTQRNKRKRDEHIGRGVALESLVKDSTNAQHPQVVVNLVSKARKTKYDSAPG